MPIKYRLQDMEQLRTQLGEAGKSVDKAQRWAINAVSRKAATHISKDIRKVYALKAGDIKNSLSVNKYQDTGRSLLYTGGKIPLERLGGKDKRVRVKAKSKKGKPFKTHRRAATARVRKDKGRKTVQPGGFLAKGRIYRRREQGRNDSAVVPMYGPSIPGMVAYPETIRGAERLVQDQLPQEFSDRLDYLLNR